MVDRESLEPPRIQVIRLCRSIRETAEIPQEAFAREHLPGKGKSQVSYFEKGESWPRDAELFVEAYARLAGTTALELWRRALDLWATEEFDGQSGAGLDRAVLRVLGQQP